MAGLEVDAVDARRARLQRRARSGLVQARRAPSGRREAAGLHGRPGPGRAAADHLRRGQRGRGHAGAGGDHRRRPARRLQDQARQAARRRVLRHDLLRQRTGPGRDLGRHPAPAGGCPGRRGFPRLAGPGRPCIEVDLTPDRGDCLGHRRAGPRGGGHQPGAALTPVDVDAGPAALIDDRFPVELDGPRGLPALCLPHHSRHRPGAVTPLWMRERLRRGGIRSISPVVDVTNYVLLELGQPMHGFDLARLDGRDPGAPGRGRRAARPAQRRRRSTLRADTLVIADAAGPVALAGIMGGAATARRVGDPRYPAGERLLRARSRSAARRAATDCTPIPPTASSAASTRSSRSARSSARPGCCWTSSAASPVRWSR